VVARYSQDFYADEPAITLNQFGQGKAVYVGTMGNEQLCDMLGNWLVNLAGVESFSSPDDIEITERRQGESRLLFLLNHTNQEQGVTLDGHYTDLLNNGSKPLTGTIDIPPRDVLILLQAEEQAGK
jgi:beta-galactosidase